jgi:two-component system response regulator FlrC
MRVLIIGSLAGELGPGRTAGDRPRRAARPGGRRSMPAWPACASTRGSIWCCASCRTTSAGWCARWPPSAWHVPVVACGTGDDPDEAVRAIRAGAREFLPLPPDPDLIAAILEAASGEPTR